MNLNYSAIPLLLLGFTLLGAFEMIPLWRKRAWRDIVVICTLLALAMSVFLATTLGIRIPPVTVFLTEFIKGMAGSQH